jgi:integrase
MSRGNLRPRVLKPAAEEPRVSWVGFHAFRHTCASMLFTEGRNARGAVDEARLLSRIGDR